MNVNGQLIVLKKHLHRENGKMKRRAFHDPGDLDRVKGLAEKYAAYDDEDYLVVQVVCEAEKPKKVSPSPRPSPEGRGSHGGERSLGMTPE